MAADRYRRDGCAVMKNGKPYGTGKDEVAAATIVQALLIAEGRIKEADDAAVK